MNTIKIIFFLLIIFSLGKSRGYAQQPSEAELLIQKIQNAEKIEQLYNVRYNLDKIGSRTDLPIGEFRKLLDAHLLLSEEFEMRSHYRNAADVYVDYLKLAEVFHKNYSKFLADSVQKANNAETLIYKSKIASLDNEITSLTKRNIEVSGLRKNYFTVGGISAAIISLIFIVILLNRNKAIRETNNNIVTSNLAVKKLFKDVVNASVLAGSVKYAQYVIAENEIIADELLQEPSEK